METLGDKIKQLRNDLTQEELASLLKVDRSTLASWEVNRREPDIATLCRIASMFNVSVDWLVGHSPSRDYKTPTKPGMLNETSSTYNKDECWQKVICTAQQYGFEPDAIHQLIEVNAKIALSLKKA
ncbi:helix-turn-helix domain-containing protein [Dendrosporobacter sp. 1207_IL3150]|uniref:helix-turn-helix domain-containing protein n=1 Tax=Dendrosporobacter sp. 1207_IL3150 TaxID=3084054 RepID=UPI002FD90166